MQKKQSEIETIDNYIATFPVDVQNKLEEFRAIIKAAAPDAVEGISYHMPSFTLNGILVYFAGWKKHIGLYAAGSAIAVYPDELTPLAGDKGTLQFSLAKPLPKELISKIIAFRVAENLKKVDLNQGTIESL